MIAVLVPAHNEQASIAACLESVQAAAVDPALRGERVLIVVALDRCTDDTGALARAVGAVTVDCSGGNVGAARRAAADVALAAGARWLACTDADTRVPRDWIAGQLVTGADAFCGVVTVDDWSGYVPGMREAFVGPQVLRDGHPHVHGANLGVSAAAYRRTRGFQSLACSEDVALVDELVLAGVRIARSITPAVMTSARRIGRARGGFADYLQALEARLCAERAAVGA